MAITRILLISPPAIVKTSWTDEMGTFPLGLASLASSLVEHGLEVRVLDAFIEDCDHHQPIADGLVRIGLPDAAIRGAIEEAAPDLIGLSIPFSCQLEAALDVARLIRRSWPTMPIVAGGNHVSAAPDSLPADLFDWLILGEGEEALPALVRALSRDDEPEAVTGVYAPELIVATPPEERRCAIVRDLDRLPDPAYGLLPLEKYWARNRGRRYVNITATRGCPFRCVFCSVHTIMGYRVRRRSAERVLAEIARLKAEHGIEEIYFEDDNLTASMGWAKRFFSALAEQDLGLRLSFRNGVRADCVDEELLGLIRRAGGSRIYFAPESGDQHTLDEIIGKRLDLEDVERAVRTAKRVGLEVACFLVIGFPGETLAGIRRTIDYGQRLRAMGADSIWVSCAVPYPGTRLFREAVASGLLDPAVDYQSLSTMDAVFSTDEFTAAEVKAIRDRAMIELNLSRHPVRRLLQRLRPWIERAPFGDRVAALYRWLRSPL